MVIDFADNDRSHQRSGVGCAESICRLGDKVFFAGAVNIAAECHVMLSRAEIKTVDIAAQSEAGPREEINAIMCGAQREAVRVIGIRIEVGFSKGPVTTCGDNYAR